MPELSEPQIRFGIFIGLFVLLAVLEFLAPRRVSNPLKARRWFTNWAIVIVDTLILRLLPIGLAVGAAEWAAAQGIGLFNLISVSAIIVIPICVIVLDFTTWFAHWASHKIPLLWTVHRMHHSDIDFDVTTAIRFHPIEIVLSMFWKMAVVVLLGAPGLAVLIFEILLNGSAMFNHSNLKLPLWLDRILRIVVVTPDMHRVHHSIVHNETDSNYGFNLAVWDRIFGTYVDQPAKGHEAMTLGLAEWQDHKPAELVWTLKVPFIKQS
ncbi:MAG: sterol desaturase family protein [Pseudomonadota bacterium]